MCVPHPHPLQVHAVNKIVCIVSKEGLRSSSSRSPHSEHSSKAMTRPTASGMTALFCCMLNLLMMKLVSLFFEDGFFVDALRIEIHKWNNSAPQIYLYVHIGEQLPEGGMGGEDHKAVKSHCHQSFSQLHSHGKKVKLMITNICNNNMWQHFWQFRVDYFHFEYFQQYCKKIT